MAASNKVEIVLSVKDDGSGKKIDVTSASVKKLGEAGVQAEKGLSTAKRGVQSISQSLERLQNLAAGAFAVNQISQYAASFITIADAMRNMDQRLLIVSKNTSDYAAAQRSVVEIARQSHQSLGDVNTLYSRMALATANLNVSQKDLADVTKTVALTVGLSGSSAQEASAGLQQFAQAMGASRLGGDELRSVLENMPQLTKIFVDAAGGSMAKLREMAEKGQLTTEWMIAAIKKGQAEIEKLAAGMPATVGKAMNDLRNEAALYIDEVNRATGFTQTLADAITYLGKNLDSVAQGGLAAMSVGASYLAARGLVAMRAGVIEAAAAVVKMGTVTNTSAVAIEKTTPAIVAQAAARLRATEADVAAATAKIALIRQEQAQVIALFAEGRANESAALRQAAFATTTSRLALAQKELSVASAANTAAQTTHSAAIAGLSANAKTTTFSVKSLATGLVGMVGPIGWIAVALSAGALAWLKWGGAAESELETAQKKLEELKRYNQSMKELADPEAGLEKAGKDVQKQYEKIQDLYVQIEKAKKRNKNDPDDNTVYVLESRVATEEDLLSTLQQTFDETKNGMRIASEKHAALDIADAVSVADYKTKLQKQLEKSTAEGLQKELLALEERRTAELDAAAKQFKDKTDLIEVQKEINATYDKEKAHIISNSKETKAAASSDKKEKKELQQVVEAYQEAVLAGFPEEENAIAAVARKYAQYRDDVEDAYAQGVASSEEATAAIANLEEQERKATESALENTDARKAAKKAQEDYNNLVLATMPEEERAVLEVRQKYDELRATWEKNIPVGIDAAEVQKLLAKATELETSELEDLKKLKAEKDIQKIKDAHEDLIEKAKKSTSALAGFVAGLEELKENMKTLGEVGYDAFNAISDGINDSIGTSLKYFVHGLDDAKEALQETRDDSLAAAQKTYDEELAALEESYAAGETAFEDYEEEKSDLYKNYMEQRQDVLTEYNEDVAKAEKQLGADLEDIWNGVLDSMLDSFAGWIGDIAMKWAASTLIEGLDLDVSLSSFLGGGPTGPSGEPAVYVTNMGGTGTSTTANGIGSGDLTDILGSTSALSTAFAAGSGWDAVATSMADSVETALDSGVTLTITDDMGLQESMDAVSLSADSFYHSLDAAVDAFGTTTSAWEQAAVDFWASDTATDAWAGQLDRINLSDMLTDDAQNRLNESTSTLSSTLTTLKPYLQAAGGALSAYSAYNQFSQGNYLGGSISAMGSASSLYQAGANAGWYTMSTMGQGLVGAAGVVGGVYGLYSGISDMLENGLTLTNGLTTALSAYTTYTSAAALYAAATGETLAAGSTLFAGLEGVGASITGSLATAAETIGVTVAETATTTAAAGASAAGTAGLGATIGAGLATAGIAAAVVTAATLIYDGFFAEDEIISEAITTALGDWTLSAKESTWAEDGYQGAGQVTQSSDAQESLISGDLSAMVEDFRKSISYLGNEWGDEFSILAAGLEDSSISAEGFIETVASLWDEQISLTTAQVEQIESLTEQAAAGSAQAAGELEVYLMDLGLAADLSASAAAALVSGADALATGYSTAISGAEDLASELYGMAKASENAGESVSSFMDYLQTRNQSTGSTPIEWYATGGVIGGVLHGGSGKVDDLYLGTVGGRAQVAMGGEYIMPQSQTEKYKPILDLMLADKYATGGVIASGTKPAGTKVYPMVDAVASDLGSLMQGIANTINASTDYAVSLQDVRQEYAEAYQEAKELGASESQLMSIRRAQAVELADLAAQHQQELGDYMRQYNYITYGATDYQQELRNLQISYRDAIAEATAMGANEENLATIRRAEAIERKELEDAHSKEVADMLEPYQRLNSGMSDTVVWLSDLADTYADALEEGKALGLAESRLNEIRAAQQVEVKNKISDEMEDIRDTIAKASMSDAAWNLQQINEQYDEQLKVLQELGATSADLSLVEEARAIAMADQNRASVNADDYATLADYQRAMYAMPKLPSFAVGTDYVPRDMIAMIHKGERITPAKYNTGGDTATAAEVAAMRKDMAEMKAAMVGMSRNSAQLNKLFGQFDDGDALTVRIAT